MHSNTIVAKSLIHHAALLCAWLFVLVAIPVAMAGAWIVYFSTYLDLPIVSVQLQVALSGVALVYALDRLLDPDPRVMVPGLSGLLVLVAGVAAVYLLMSMIEMQDRWPIIVLCALFCLGNCFGKRIPLAKTFFVTAVWLSTCVLLTFPTYEWSVDDIEIILMWTLLFAVSCVMCDIKDINIDRKQQIASMPVYLGLQQCLSILTLILIACVCWAIFAWQIPLLLLSILLLCVLRLRVLHHVLLAPAIVDGILFMCACVGHLCVS